MAWVGVSWMPDPRFRAAIEPALPLVEAVEHTLEHGFGAALPPSTRHVLDVFGPLGRLYGHAVEASVFSADREDRFEAWLDHLRRRRDDVVLADVSEHYGFCTGGPFASGAPLPLPEVAVARDRAVDRLTRIREALSVPVGLENLALAFSRRQALAQGAFVTEVLDRVDGFVHLDLHNLWCQVRNFGLDPEVLLATWPLDRVWRVHVSGGSDRDGIRRDTHDHRVPEEVWALLAEVLPRLPACRALILEQLPSALGTPAEQEAFRDDLARLHAVRDAAPAATAGSPSPPRARATPGTTLAELLALQRALLDTLDRRAGADALAALRDHPASAPFRGWVDDLEPRLLTVAHLLVHRWGVRDG
jgi:uncharacterized protein (UPF0276 family)